MLNKFTQYSARFNQFYTVFFLIVDADDFFLAFETNCTEFRHALFPRERDLYIHESNGNVRTYENQAYMFPDKKGLIQNCLLDPSIFPFEKVFYNFGYLTLIHHIVCS